ncbi:hypothetical protein NVP1161O_068 [Vibrio phage 1.161.O._10N.261.48.C5]|nr:hypothetical protein NVP1161O_068 [Vibrio phage 1.161.O._10N.261.48.C5]
MELQSIDHVEDGLTKFTSRLDQEEVKRFVTIFLERYQNVENSLLVLSNQKSIDLSEGIWLDYIGKLLNVPRNAASDEGYRIELRRKIVARSSNGTPNKIIQLVKEFTSSVVLENPNVMYREQNKAYAVLIVNSQTGIGRGLYNLVEQIRPAGVNLKILNDFNDNAFYPVYELEKSSGSTFQVTKDGTTYDNFQVTFDGLNFNEFDVFNKSEDFYQPSIKGNQNSFYYEEGSTFQVTKDGSNYEDFQTSDKFYELKDFKVVAPYNEGYIPENIRPLVWEVTKDSEDI